MTHHRRQCRRTIDRTPRHWPLLRPDKVSAVGTNRTSWNVRSIAANGGKADMGWTAPFRERLTQWNFNSYLDRRRFLSPLTLPALQGTALPQAWKLENLR
jgi:hypothetical protein